jgi:hypothetical protein
MTKLGQRLGYLVPFKAGVLAVSEGLRGRQAVVQWPDGAALVRRRNARSRSPVPLRQRPAAPARAPHTAVDVSFTENVSPASQNEDKKVA